MSCKDMATCVEKCEIRVRLGIGICLEFCIWCKRQSKIFNILKCYPFFWQFSVKRKYFNVNGDGDD